MFSTIRFAGRRLVQDRAFAATAVLALSLAIAANLTVFTLLNGVFLRDLPIADPDRVLAISTVNAADLQRPFDNMSVPDVRDLQTRLRTLAAVAATDEVSMTIVDDGRAPERVSGAYVTGNALSVLGVAPVLGRTFTARDDEPGAEAVAILGQTLWRTRYGSDPRVIGRTLRIDGAAATVVGVMPEGFGFPTEAALWAPFSVREGTSPGDRGVRNVDAFGRLAAGVTVAQASAELTAVMSALAGEYPDTNAGIGPRVEDLRDANTGGPIPIVAKVLFAAVTLLLLIACANVANLLLARAAVRARELSLRVTLGASRARLVGQLLTESVVLSSAGAAIGLPLAGIGIRLFHAAIRGTGEPYWLAFPIDARVVAFAVALTALTAALFGLVPALQATQRSLVDVLGDGGHTVAGFRRHRRWSGGLVVAQVALMLTLLTGAGLMMRDVSVRTQIDAGIDVDTLVSMQIDLPERTYPDAAARRLFYQQLDEQLAAVPGAVAGSGTSAPLGDAFSRPVTIDGELPPPERTRQPRVSNLMVGPTYFDAIGIRATQGRLFTSADGTGSAVAVVNERFAARFFGDGPVVGRRVALDARPGVAASGWATIVGVVPNVRHEEADARIIETVVYLPHAQAPLASARIVVRAGSDVAGVTAGVRAAVARVDPALPMFNVARVRDALLAGELWTFRVFGTLVTVFALLALLLAAVGLYGITAYSVATRRRELGVRIALGAPVGHLLWTVTRRTAGQVLAGLVLGSGGAALMALVVGRLLFSISPFDPATFAGVAVLCLAAAVASCIGPAAQALRTDPITVLRES